MKNNLSLYKFCVPCNSKCCEDVGGIGSPILTKQERDKYEKIKKGVTEEITSLSGKKYYLLKVKSGTNHCIFLSSKCKCKIQDIKPMDCVCYPIKAIYNNNKIIFVLDSSCPASKHLSKEFIDKAKKVSLDSIKRFDKQTFQHWLDNYIGWVKLTGKELK